jgi:hypothetical protein
MKRRRQTSVQIVRELREGGRPLCEGMYLRGARARNGAAVVP